MEAQKQRETGEPEPPSLSRILLSANNPIVSSAQISSSSEEIYKKKPVGQGSLFEFVQIVPEIPKESGSHKNMERLAEISCKNSTTSSSGAMEKAKDLEASFSREYPSFAKEMQRCNLSPTFFLRLPRDFCMMHLPACEETLVLLEDENGKQYKTKYLERYPALSGGWNRFSISKNLQEGDVLVFHLVRPWTFKVHILGKNYVDAVNGDPVIPERRKNNFKTKRPSKKPKNDPIVANISQEKSEANNPPITADARFSKSTISGFRNFKIVVNKHIINSEIPKHTRNNYFSLCHTRKALLHRNLIKGIGRKLAASIISETINIVDAIRNSEMSTPREDVLYWNTALQSFEFLGMDVSFIRSRLNRLLDIERDCSNAVMDFKKNENADVESECARIEEEIQEYEKKIQELKIMKRRVELGGEENVAEIVDKCKVKYKEEAKAPW